MFLPEGNAEGDAAGTPTKRLAHSGSSDKSTNYVVGGELITQLALVNLGCIPVHVMGTRTASPRKPDWLCFDLDPESGKFGDAAAAALHVKEALDALELTAFVKTSGNRGIHVFVPLRLGPDADDVLGFAEGFVKRLAAAHPKELTVEHSIAARKGRVYLDPFRNGFAQTVVAPYSVRRRPKAPVSTPLNWSEVKPALDPSDFNIGNFANRLKRGDPWEEFFESRQALKDADAEVVACLNSRLFSTEKQNHVEQHQNGHGHLDGKRTRFVELIDHHIVEFADSAQLFIHQIAIFGDAHPGGCQAVEARVINIADEFDGVIDAFGELHHVEANGIEAPRIAGTLQRENKTFLLSSSASYTSESNCVISPS